VTDRGKPVLRKNPAIETLQKAEAQIEKRKKTLADGLDLD